MGNHLYWYEVHCRSLGDFDQLGVIRLAKEMYQLVYRQAMRVHQLDYCRMSLLSISN